MGNRWMRAFAALLVASICMLAESAPADEIRVMSSNAFRQAYLELAPEFEKASGLLPVAGIEVIGMLPPDAQEFTVFAAGIHAGAKEPAAAKALMLFLASPATAPVKRKKGMEPG